MLRKELYLISDLHIGGDAELDGCDFERELIEFFEELKNKAGDVELIIGGDAFGFWELTEIDGVEKLGAIIASHKDLFDAFRRTGKHIAITLIPGNHDYELACYPEFVGMLREYNITLEPKEHITRVIGGRTIWIEHGHQRDRFNRISHFGSPHVTPLGYHVTRHVVSSAGKHAIFGKQKWLRDIESVQPNEQVPHWMFSNYFYREMSPLLRYGMLPFLLCFGASIFWFVGATLEKYRILHTRIFSTNFLKSFGILGDIQDIIFTVNGVAILFLVLFSIPFALVVWDFKRTLLRYGFKTTSGIRIQKREIYRAAAEEIFAADPQVAVYVFGHTHDAFVEQVDGRAIINMGTWLKKLTRVSIWFRWLPDVYVPSFRLNVFRICERDGGIAIDYEYVPKETESGLTLLQRVMILAKARGDGVDIPETTRLKPDGENSSAQRT
ncbi:MAG: hypothetical protein GXP25_12765 [Planctomycetes bacterium]|nr:hypothetical protein [Planctomycetota bacterium]